MSILKMLSNCQKKTKEKLKTNKNENKNQKQQNKKTNKILKHTQSIHTTYINTCIHTYIWY